jgi:uncharacterized protein involved in type VI secretion and phage assembly
MNKLNGVFPAVVIDNVDPENLGRVKVRLPALGLPDKQEPEILARIATLMAGKNRGTWFIPEISDEVLVAFEAGDIRRPYVIGCLWSSANPPPEKMEPDNNKKLLCSRNGVKITIDDQSGQESFIVETPGGQRITLKDGPASIEFTDNNGNSVQFDTNGIMVNTTAKVTISASQVELNSGMVSINAGMAKFSGVVQCDTLITNSVISASYTPGAGNVL